MRFAGTSPRPANDERRSYTAFIGFVLAPSQTSRVTEIVLPDIRDLEVPVVALVASEGTCRTLIAREYDEGATAKSKLVQLVQQEANLTIQGPDFAQILAHRHREIILQAILVDQELTLVEVLLSPEAEVSSVEVELSEALKQRRGRIDRIVGDVTPDIDVERSILVILDELDGGREDVSIPTGRVIRPDCTFLNLENAVGAISVYGTDMPLAKMTRPISVASQKLRHRGTIVKAPILGELAETRGIPTRHETSATRAASHPSDVELSKSRPLSCQSVDRGSSSIGMSIDA